MDKYIDDGLIYEFSCECGHKWKGVDTGDGFCEKCGEYSTDAKPLMKGGNK
jgi:hypothetical protein